MNSVDTLFSESILATGDDFGYVNIYNYPCLEETSQSWSLKGHSEHVVWVMFANEGRNIISVGGYDQTVVLWTRVGAAPLEKPKRAALVSDRKMARITERTEEDDESAWKPAREDKIPEESKEEPSLDEPKEASRDEPREASKDEPSLDEPKELSVDDEVKSDKEEPAKDDKSKEAQ